MNEAGKWKKVRETFDEFIKKSGIKVPKGTIPIRKHGWKIRGLYVLDETKIPYTEIDCEETMKTKE